MSKRQEKSRPNRSGFQAVDKIGAEFMNSAPTLSTFRSL